MEKSTALIIIAACILGVAILFFSEKKMDQKVETQFNIEQQKTQLVIDSLMAKNDSLLSTPQEVLLDTIYTDPEIRYVKVFEKDTVVVRDTIEVERKVKFEVQPQFFEFSISKEDSLDINWRTKVWGYGDVLFDKEGKVYTQTELQALIQDLNVSYVSQTPIITTTEYKVDPLFGIVFSQYNPKEDKYDAGIGFLYHGSFWGSVNTSGTIGIGYEFSPKSFRKVFGL